MRDTPPPKAPKAPSTKRRRRPRKGPPRQKRKTTPQSTRKTPPPKRRPIRLRRLILPVILVFLTGLYALWSSIDRKVTARLNSINNPRLPVILSAPFDLSGFITRLGGYSAKNAATARAALIERRYSEVQSSVSRPGDFSLSESAISVYARSFTDHLGQTIPARKETITWRDSDSSSQKFLLEPQVVSYIGSADSRASSFVAFDAIPAIVQKAVLSIEDERFYKHFGLDPYSIVRAVIRNIIALRFAEGGSTLTQQLAKNLFLSPKKTFSRKLLEVPTALSIERHLSKKEILELYLNEVYLGQEGSVAIHGMPEAASAFFGKKLEDLRLEEAATLAGMIKAPSFYNPRRFPDRARERRDVVLRKMRENGEISEAEFTLAKSRHIKTVNQHEHRRLAPFFTAALESDLSQVLDLEHASRSGLSVYTGLDLGLQRCAEQAVEKGTAEIEKSKPNLSRAGARLEATIVAIEPYSGLIKAWVGGRDFSESQFNRVTQSTRQIGSTIKPFLYLTALDGSLNSYKVATAASVVEDKPMEFKTKGQKAWNPENFDHDYRGDVTVRYALENSLNMPALYIAERVGLSAVKRALQGFELSAKDFSAVPSLALGALDTNLLRLTSAYGALANGGIFVEPRLYSVALDSENERLSTPKIREKRVADEAATFILTNIMQGVIERGTGKAARTKGFSGPAAGKTGTSDSSRDAWFVGFTPTIAAGIWVGLDDNSPTGLTGGGAAAPIWGDFMACASPYLNSPPFIPPREVITVAIDQDSGLRAVPSCPTERVVNEVFVQGTEPELECAGHDG
jgi:penicillin-binding protein 1B